VPKRSHIPLRGDDEFLTALLQSRRNAWIAEVLPDEFVPEKIFIRRKAIWTVSKHLNPFM
jgi:hypothetical protein